MPRTARATVGGFCYQVLNRGNARRAVFHKDGDFRAFRKALGQVAEEIALRPLGYCLMPNPFHWVLWPQGDNDLSRGLHGLLTAQGRRYHRHDCSSGHLGQGRFKAFPIQDDEHLLTVMRYVESNPLRAGMVGDLRDYPWTSYPVHGLGRADGLVSEAPVWPMLGAEEGARQGYWRGWVH